MFMGDVAGPKIGAGDPHRCDKNRFWPCWNTPLITYYHTEFHRSVGVGV